MQKSSAFILPSIVQKCGTYSKRSSLSFSAKLSLSAIRDVWLANPAVKIVPAIHRVLGGKVHVSERMAKKIIDANAFEYLI